MATFYTVKLKFADADDLAALMVALAQARLLAFIDELSIVESEKTTAPPQRKDIQDALDQKREDAVKSAMRPKRKWTDYKEIQRKANERGTSGLTRMQTILKGMMMNDGKITLDEVNALLKAEKLPTNSNPMTPVVTRHLARAVSRGSYQITPDGANYIMAVTQGLKDGQSARTA